MDGIDPAIRAGASDGLKERFWQLGRDLGLTEDRIQAVWEKMNEVNEETTVEYRARLAEQAGRDLVHDPEVTDEQFGAVVGAALAELNTPDAEEERP